MFEQLLQIVKDQVGNNADLSSSIPEEHSDAIHQEIANTIANNTGSTGGNLISSMLSGGSITNEVTEGLVQTLSQKFGLSPEVASTISAQVPGIMEKVLNKNNESGENNVGDIIGNLFK